MAPDAGFLEWLASDRRRVLALDTVSAARFMRAANSLRYARRIPAARLVTIETGHDMQRADSATLLARAVDDFLSGPP